MKVIPSPLKGWHSQTRTCGGKELPRNAIEPGTKQRPHPTATQHPVMASQVFPHSHFLSRSLPGKYLHGTGKRRGKVYEGVEIRNYENIPAPLTGEAMRRNTKRAVEIIHRSFCIVFTAFTKHLTIYIRLNIKIGLSFIC